MVVLGQGGCNPAKVDFFSGKSGFILTKWLYSGKSGCILAKFLHSGKSG